MSAEFYGILYDRKALALFILIVGVVGDSSASGEFPLIEPKRESRQFEPRTYGLFGLRRKAEIAHGKAMPLRHGLGYGRKVVGEFTSDVLTGFTLCEIMRPS